MNIDSALKKEGIKVIKELNPKQVKAIAANVASKLCLSFYDHSLSRKDLYNSLCNVKMYFADMELDLSGAKYFYRNNSIYFNKDLTLDEMFTVATHECIHFIQCSPDQQGRISRMGLYNFSSGLGINEATVQLMASDANNSPVSEETYYGISIKTISPNYYPLECALVNQLSYFTGTYPLYHSALNSNDVFKNTIIAKSSKKIYNIITRNLDKLLNLENSLNYFSYELEYSNKSSDIKSLNILIDSKKKLIVKLFFETQNLIIKEFFNSEFEHIRTLTDAKLFQKRLYKFKNKIGVSENYSFYNYFYVQMMDKLVEKENYIKEFGELNSFSIDSYALVSINNVSSSFTFIKTFFEKLKKLFHSKEELPSYWQQ